MANCPVCETEYTENEVETCAVCGYDLTPLWFLDKPPDVFLEKERKRIAAAKRVWQQSQCQLQSAQKMVSQFQSQLDGIVERIDSLNKEQNQQQLQNLQSQLDKINQQIGNLSRSQSQQKIEIIEAIESQITILLELQDIPIVSKFSGLDYTQLRRFLKSEQWELADSETIRMMLAVAGQTERGYLNSDDIKHFPCEDLRIIDGLWVKCSNGRFGFSVQKQIYINCGVKLDGNEPGRCIESMFLREVGWLSDDILFVGYHPLPFYYYYKSIDYECSPRAQDLGQWAGTEPEYPVYNDIVGSGVTRSAWRTLLSRRDL